MSNSENDENQAYDPNTSVSFAQPTVDENATSAPLEDQAIAQNDKEDKKNNFLVNLTEGNVTFAEPFTNCSTMYPYANAYTSTNIKSAYRDVRYSMQNRNSNTIYPYNTNYEKYTAYHMHNNVLASANPPPEAKRQLPSTFRLGNNSDINHDMKPYVNPNKLNSGPFNISMHNC
tara:strand:+ start:5082 stop:5603 length:522 start_codon:yes stop_codon:yes gene_type:complete